MKIDDMILVSIDDHVIEPPDLFDKHMPEKYRDSGPKFERLPNGVDQWVFQGEVMGTVGLGATASWPREEWNFDPVGLAEMRPGCYDIHQRVRDMNANGVLSSMNFPTAAGFAGAWLAGKPDQQLSRIAVSAYNDWQLDELAGSYPGRVIPLCILPLWDTEACVVELERIAAKGCTTVTLSRDAVCQRPAELLRRPLGRCARGGRAPRHRAVDAHRRGVQPAHQAGRGAARPAHRARCPIVGRRLHRSHHQRHVRQVPRPEGRAVRGRYRLGAVPARPGRQAHVEPVVDAPRHRRQERHRDLEEELPRLLHHRAQQPAAARPHRRPHGGLGVRLPALRLHLAEVARGVDGRVRRRRPCRST